MVLATTMHQDGYTNQGGAIIRLKQLWPNKKGREGKDVC
jgi:hypothetical protein